LQTKTIRSHYDYENEESLSLNPSGAKADIGKLTFSMSSESIDFRKANSKYKKIMYKTTADCLEYIAGIPDLDKPPPVDDNFQFVVNAASAEKDYYTIFDMYGLHFPVTLHFGARYGFTQLIEESKWSSFAQNLQHQSVMAGVTEGIKTLKGLDPLSLNAAVDVKHSSIKDTSQMEMFDSYFSEVKEFSLGRRLPNDGGVEAWVKQIQGEPMPIRYDLTSICKHPAFTTKRGKCETYSNTYCTQHLALSTGNGINCDPAEKTECTWDMDCLPDHRCGDEGACVQLPTCKLELFSENDFQGNKKVFGPITYRDAPMGKVFDVYEYAKINSAKVSTDCEQVILMDYDYFQCLEDRNDNIIMGTRTGIFSIRDLPWDLQSDICGVKLLAAQPGSQH